jgi:hypothetical protein
MLRMGPPNGRSLTHCDTARFPEGSRNNMLSGVRAERSRDEHDDDGDRRQPGQKYCNRPTASLFIIVFGKPTPYEGKRDKRHADEEHRRALVQVNLCENASQIQFGLIQLRPCGCGWPGIMSSQLSSHIRSCHWSYVIGIAASTG